MGTVKIATNEYFNQSLSANSTTREGERHSQQDPSWTQLTFQLKM